MAVPFLTYGDGAYAQIPADAGGGTSASYAALSVSLRPVITAPTISTIRHATFTALSDSTRPVISAPTMTATGGVQNATYTALSDSVRPTITAPTTTGVRKGTFTALSDSTRPVITAPTTTGVRKGTFTALSDSVRPAITAPTVAGQRYGTFTALSDTTTPVITAPVVTGMLKGIYTALTDTIRPVITAPTIVTSGVQNATYGALSDTTTPIITAPTLTGTTGTTIDVQTPQGNAGGSNKAGKKKHDWERRGHVISAIQSGAYLAEIDVADVLPTSNIVEITQTSAVEAYVAENDLQINSLEVLLTTITEALKSLEIVESTREAKNKARLEATAYKLKVQEEYHKRLVRRRRDEEALIHILMRI